MARSLSLGLALGLSIVTSEVTGQTLPIPALPAEPANETLSRSWEYAVGAGLGYDNNIDFAGPDGPSGMAIAPRGQIGRVFFSPRGRVNTTLSGRWTGYPTESNLSRYYGDLGLDGEYQLSAHSKVSAGVSYQRGHSDAAKIVLDQGVALPLVKSQSIVSKVGLAQRLGTRTTLRLDGRYYRTTFDSDTLVDGASVRADVAIERQLSARGTAAVVYAVEDFLAVGATRVDYLSHFGSLQWTRVLSARAAILLEGGASYTPDAALVGLERTYTFFGGASFTRQIARSNVLVYVRREINPGFGLGASLLESRVGARGAVPLGRDWRLLGGFAYSHPDPPSDPAAVRLYAPYADGFVAVARHLGKSLEASVESRYRRRGETSVVAVTSSFQAGFYLTFSPGRAKLPDLGLY